ncbi:hypothetical protein EOPP23_13315 [Endozoicomonas sp. OPT23]|uniref:hypothetical protein n=1 Tax=Endozoicomonas sp. OPT23 TaxID=2072845 RepID=UPI00129B8B11|nr:hypothetical protein [Endozoicomonas sp. OPT23]MRI33969.1 hypothetical protein [Endozoicomonas sp. OPT23]
MLNHSYLRYLPCLLLLTVNEYVCGQSPATVYCLEVRIGQDEHFQCLEPSYTEEDSVLTVSTLHGDQVISYTISAVGAQDDQRAESHLTHELTVDNVSISVADIYSSIVQQMSPDTGEVNDTGGGFPPLLPDSVLSWLPGQYLTLYGGSVVPLGAGYFVYPVFYVSSVIASEEGSLQLELGDSVSHGGMSSGHMTIRQNGAVDIHGHTVTSTLGTVPLEVKGHVVTTPPIFSSQISQQSSDEDPGQIVIAMQGGLPQADGGGDTEREAAVDITEDIITDRLTITDEAQLRSRRDDDEDPDADGEAGGFVAIQESNSANSQGTSSGTEGKQVNSSDNGQTKNDQREKNASVSNDVFDEKKGVKKAVKPINYYPAPESSLPMLQ